MRKEEMAKLKKHPAKSIPKLVSRIQAILQYNSYPVMSMGTSLIMESEINWFIHTRLKHGKK